MTAVTVLYVWFFSFFSERPYLWFIGTILKHCTSPFWCHHWLWTTIKRDRRCKIIQQNRRGKHSASPLIWSEGWRHSIVYFNCLNLFKRQCHSRISLWLHWTSYIVNDWTHGKCYDSLFSLFNVPLVLCRYVVLEWPLVLEALSTLRTRVGGGTVLSSNIGQEVFVMHIWCRTFSTPILFNLEL